MSSSSTLNVRGRLVSLASPLVMGILNATPDSFYAASRSETLAEAEARARQIVAEGGQIIDVGACSTRPGSTPPSCDEELRRLETALEGVRRACPEAVVSVDTYRAAVAGRAVRELGADIINDITGGQDPHMYEVAALTHAPYILMHTRGTPATMAAETHYDDLVGDLLRYFALRVGRLHEMGVADIILDPGFGFAKTLEQNYELMARLDELHVLGCPLLVGVSRKSMVYRLLHQEPDEALTGTTALHMAALLKGAAVLRVHDVRAASETIAVYQALRAPSGRHQP